MMQRRRGSDRWAAPLWMAGGLLLPLSSLAPTQTPGPVPLFEQILALLANPNVAYCLFVLGLLGLVGEFVTPGAIYPGVFGAICLVLGLVGFGQLPTNWGGALLILAAVVMFVVDLKLPGHGLSIAGAVAFALGSFLLFTPFWITRPVAVETYLSPWLVLGMTVGVAAFFILGAMLGLAAQGRPAAIGRETLLGKAGIVRRALAPEGIVHIEGEEWSAVSADGHPIPEGAGVRVVGVDGLTLQVEPAAAPEREMARPAGA